MDTIELFENIQFLKSISEDNKNEENRKKN